MQTIRYYKTTYTYSKDPKQAFRDKYKYFKTKIRTIIKADSSYGILRIKNQLYRKYKITIDKQTLGRLLKYWGLLLKRTQVRYRPSFIEKVLKLLGNRANLLRNAIIDAPLRAISSDITEIVYANGKTKAYVAVHKDIHAQVAYGWHISQDMKKDLVISSLKKAVRSIQKIFKIKTLPQKLIWHQDQGSQYTSYEYINEIMKYGRISYSRKATPIDNPGQESFFGRFKDEHKMELFECESFQEVSWEINKIIKGYNYHRLHTSIGYVPPMEFLKNAIAKFF